MLCQLQKFRELRQFTSVLATSGKNYFHKSYTVKPLYSRQHRDPKKGSQICFSKTLLRV